MTQLMPCSWEVLECGELPATGSPEREELRVPAAEILWALSGRQFGTCELTVRPCTEDCCVPCLPPAGAWDSGTQWYPALVNGQWFNLVCRKCRGRCSCPEVSEVLLPGPVDSVVEVLVDGSAVDPGAYRIDDLVWLVRTDGAKWPKCQDMGPPVTEAGTWAVKIMRGTPVPMAGQRALGEMMSEMWKACRGDKTCCLPRRAVTSIATKGAVMGLDPMEFLKEGKTGLYWTDLWLTAVNPLYRPSGARVTSPDMEDVRVTTWP
jgi:hypothetical protein